MSAARVRLERGLCQTAISKRILCCLMFLDSSLDPRDKATNFVSIESPVNTIPTIKIWNPTVPNLGAYLMLDPALSGLDSNSRRLYWLHIEQEGRLPTTNERAHPCVVYFK
jgi:hypothetical protein